MVTDRDRQELNRIVKDNLELFYNAIFDARKNNHDKLFNNFGFPMFGTIPSEYYEQVYFASYLEYYTRQLINGIIREIALINSADEFKWICNEHWTYIGYTNKEYEHDFDFEFINLDTCTGYRYTYLDRDDGPEEHAKALMKKYGLKQIHIVDWIDEDSFGCFSYRIPGIKLISPKTLFNEVLLDGFECDEINQIYDTIIDCVTNAVSKARGIIGLQTIPQFSGWYLHKNRESLEHRLKENINEIAEFTVLSPNHEKTQEASKYIIKDKEIINRYLNERLFKILIGNSIIARSYLTSEYLFSNFSGNNIFDYTPVVSGYLKSIEQLLCTICVKYRYRKRISFDFKPFTLGKYIQFIEKHQEIISYADPLAIINCLHRYKNECRNQLFHKDNIDSWERVNIIRDNTHYLYIVILGAFDLGNNIINDFEILDESYDQLFRKLQSINYGYYEIELSNHTKHKVKYINECLPIEVDLNGLIITPITLNEIDNDYRVTGESIMINDKNIPSYIWDIAAGKKDLIWKSSQ